MNKQELNNKLKQSFNSQLMSNDNFLSLFEDIKQQYKVKLSYEAEQEKILLKRYAKSYILSLMKRDLNRDLLTTNWYKVQSKRKRKNNIRIPKKIKHCFLRDNFIHISYTNTFKHIIPIDSYNFDLKLFKHYKHMLKHAKNNQLPYLVYKTLGIPEPIINIAINENNYHENVLR